MLHPKLMIKDSKGEKSLTATAFAVGFLVVLVKLLISGITVGDVQMSDFTGGEFAAAIGALGGIYVMRRSPIANSQEKSTAKKK